MIADRDLAVLVRTLRNRFEDDGGSEDVLFSAAQLIKDTILESNVARPLAEWHEDMGPVLWWRFPVDEEPWCGTPNFCSWPGYAILSPGRHQRWQGDGRQYDRDTARLIEAALRDRSKG